ncbi:MAG: hypothetical protein ACUVWZ_05625, partial [Anaerolineae bacterium]
LEGNPANGAVGARHAVPRARTPGRRPDSRSSRRGVYGEWLAMQQDFRYNGAAQAKERASDLDFYLCWSVYLRPPRAFEIRLLFDGCVLSGDLGSREGDAWQVLAERRD